MSDVSPPRPFADARWVFFDFGYTLMDETPAWEDRYAAMSAAIARRGRQISVDQLRAMFHHACETFEPKQWKALCRSAAASDADAGELEQLATGWKHELQVPHDGAGEVLRKLSATRSLGIIANQAAGTADRVAKAGWASYFRLIIGSAEAGVMKPDAAIFRLALERADCPPNRAVMVGDRIDNDVRPAKALGMRTIHVRQGGSARQKPRDASDVADVTVDGIADIVHFL